MSDLEYAELEQQETGNGSHVFNVRVWWEQYTVPQTVMRIPCTDRRAAEALLAALGTHSLMTILPGIVITPKS